MAISVELHKRDSIESITTFLTAFHPPSLEDVAVRFRVFNEDIFYAVYSNDVKYVEACLNLEAALSKFPRRRLSFLRPSKIPARKRLWTRELGKLFPALRDLNKLTLTLQSSEGLKSTV